MQKALKQVLSAASSCTVAHLHSSWQKPCYKACSLVRKRQFVVAAGSQGPLNELNNGPGQREHTEDAGNVLDEFIGPGLQLMEQTVELEGGQVLTLVVPRSSDAVMDYYINAGRFDKDPYWCRAWPSAIALGRTLLRRRELVRGKRVCEVGCGLGIAGIAAAIAGASQVVLTDREPLALECALRTAKASGLASVACTHGDDMNRAAQHQVTAQLMDWTSANPGLGKFDVVLACDVLYEEPAVVPVANLMPELLAGGGSYFILADPEARTRAHRQEFLRLLVSNKQFPMCVETSETLQVALDGISTAVQLVVFCNNPFGQTIGVKSL